jgi:hypothetical protein
MAKGDDARSRGQIDTQTQRYNQQQGPMANAMSYNYGRGSEANYGDYTDIMNRYRGIAGGGGAGSVGGGGFDASGMYTPFQVSYSDPFKSYGGFEEFSQTGGYSKDDIANMRSRGVSPIRAAYSNAEREVGRQRSLQGGYSPNATATLAKMAREQSQGAADAMQNINAGLAEAVNKGRLSGLTGMSGIEGQRLDAQLKAGMFNAEAQARAQAQNIGAAESAAGRAGAASAQSAENQMAALRGMTSLYGTTPGMSNMFGNQLLQGVEQGGRFGLGVMGAQNQAGQMPGQWEQNVGRLGDISQMANMAYPWIDMYNNRNRQPSGGGGYGPAGAPPEGGQYG